MLHCNVGARVQLHVHLKLDTAFGVSGRIPNSHGIKRKYTRKLVMLFFQLLSQNVKLLHHQCLFRAAQLFSNARQVHVYDLISYDKRSLLREFRGNDKNT